MPITQATEADIPGIVALLNSAYRGDESKNGWTTEADLLEGSLRTDEATLLSLIRKPHARFLQYTTPGGAIGGCVFLEKQHDRLYLGMLSVSPRIQASGIGSALMAEAEHVAKQEGCSGIFMRVITARPELIAWYERKGYRDSGLREPFRGDERFGKPTKPLEFMILEKKIE